MTAKISKVSMSGNRCGWRIYTGRMGTNYMLQTKEPCIITTIKATNLKKKKIENIKIRHTIIIKQKVKVLCVKQFSVTKNIGDIWMLSGVLICLAERVIQMGSMQASTLTTSLTLD